MIKIVSIEQLLSLNLVIPNYQRPYKWTPKNIGELLEDISRAIHDAEHLNDFRYRIGSIILHDNHNEMEIVDGQQRTISLLLLRLFLDPSYECPLLGSSFTSKESISHLHENYSFIEDWFSLSSYSMKKNFVDAFSDVLEVVIISVNELSEAFQLFDSQNTRGKPLDPHDLLKAYHLRAMRDYPYEMRHVVKEWESVSSQEIRAIFNYYLFPARKWALKEKCSQFRTKDIELFKGIPESSNYTYAKRAKKAMPYFQMTEAFTEGEDFFFMVLHYLNLKNDMVMEIASDRFFQINQILNHSNYHSTGFNYSRNLFYCALLCYYDKFHNFDERAVIKLFTWALMLRIDMENLGFDSVNKYAIGEWNDKYTNACIPMFSIIAKARTHHVISNIQIKVRQPDENQPDMNQPGQETKKMRWALYWQLLNLKREGGIDEQTRYSS